jgi:hypothetical protein
VKATTAKCALILLLRVKILHLAVRTDLFKVGNLVYGGKEIVVSLYGSLEETDRQTDSLGRL